MKNKLIAVVFVILLLAGAVPFKFTAMEGLYLFGWLPVALAYWWVLMIVNLIFVILVCRSFVRNAEKEKQQNEGDKDE